MHLNRLDTQGRKEHKFYSSIANTIKLERRSSPNLKYNFADIQNKGHQYHIWCIQKLHFVCMSYGLLN